MKRRVFDLTIMLICTSIFLWCVYPYMNNQKDTEKEIMVSNDSFSEEGIVVNTQADFTVWYTNSSLQSYIMESAHMYSTGMNIELVQVPALDYLENINKLNLNGEGMPDLYILDSEMLEKAYLAGLTLNNSYSEYDKKTYSNAALSAATYHDNLVAYPFYFDTSFLVYNKDLVKEAPETFDDIIEFAQYFDAASVGVENILKWDVKNILYNYGFIGGYLGFGGENGDDSTTKNLNKEKVISCLNYYHNLYQYFSIDLNNSNYDSIVEEFINGKTVFSILSINSIEKLNKSGMNYGIANFPDITSDLKSKNISATKVIVVNPYSKNIEKAKKFAKYLTYDNTEKVYDLTGYMACRQLESYHVNGLEDVMEQYRHSVNLPKLMSTRDYWIQLQDMLNNVWTGADINTELEKLESKVRSYSTE